jgi:methylated-DNA-[protein]-cysteine S-methyltransferase
MSEIASQGAVGAWTIYASPIGELSIARAASGALIALRFPGEASFDPAARRDLPDVARQLDQYFAGERRSFELELELRGSRFQLAVWERLRRIPFGATASYGELAADIDEAIFPPGLEVHERARAVGTEVGRTPIPIVVPCHRVIGAEGSLTGYGGGLERKQALLDLESDQLVLC